MGGLISGANAASMSLPVGVRHTMKATLLMPDGPGPHPGVLVLHTSGGLEPADLAYAQRLAQAGYVCLVPAFMAAYGISAQDRRTTFTLDAQPIYADLADAVAQLRQQPQVAGSKIAAVGFSNGGYFAAWLAAAGAVQAAVSYYGALSGAGTDIELQHFQQVFTAGSSPLLILHGTSDGTVPVEAARRLAGILDAVHAPYTIQLYLGAGHRFDRETASAVDGTAADDAWQRTLAFLKQYLAP
ncbi:MAG TPA: dienelactone hydrolase family protein [bacterium]|nr:dienelactone hydrolase family protein [bacterium]